MTQDNIAAASMAAPQNMLTKPVLAALLEERSGSAIIVGVAVTHAGLVIAGLPAWQCPIRAATGVPCPGCGLSRATSALIHGDWRSAMDLHIFAPLFVLIFAVMAIVTLLPAQHHQRAVNMIRAFERRTGLVTITLLGLMLYWAIRLLWTGFGPV